ncbi:MAG: 2-oxoacid:acceptor oxidoreductase family protein, partial [Chloroflexi bacterium]|nr:2-oxoacid:acceptor oxidoreductase family protein [Chloroflexota bacterium]MCI0731637.1 2-oxoacid:acceptor oxidoreductase family protein [Chloroflexota bacterium]
IVTARSERSNIEAVYVPANAIAEELGTAKMLNVAALGALLARRPILPMEAVERALAKYLAEKPHLVEANYRVLRRGWELASPAIPAYL